MFEERCLVCGLHLADDGYVLHAPPSLLLATHLIPRRAYCSDDCENNDMYSPSISSSSSVLSSPQLGYTLGGDVPSLMLGSALKNYTARNHYSTSSSSSTSSASWSLFTDDEDRDANHQYSSSSEYSHHDGPDSVFDPNMKIQNSINSLNPSALSYTRIPSSTNNQSLVPQVKPHSRSRHVGGSPSIQSHALLDDASDADFSSLDPESEVNNNLKRSRNRASLSACFSLLQIISPRDRRIIRSPPISSSSGNATVRQSPPTPRLLSKLPSSTLNMSPTVVPLSSLYNTPRGRRREAGRSSCGNRSGNSSQSSSRRRRRVRANDSPHHAMQHSLLQGYDWTAQEFALLIRGRPTIRRSSSPLSRVVISDAMNAGMRSTASSSPFCSRSRPRPRGRTRVEDLDGIGSSMDAPGYGSGRSGLVNRERTLHFLQVPL